MCEACVYMYMYTKYILYVKVLFFFKVLCLGFQFRHITVNICVNVHLLYTDFVHTVSIVTGGGGGGSL